MKYKVQNLQNDEYQVIEVVHKISTDQITTNPQSAPPEEVVVCQGTLADCQAWINLKERGYM